MMTKNRTQFVFIIAAGLSLISGFSQTVPTIIAASAPVVAAIIVGTGAGAGALAAIVIGPNAVAGAIGAGICIAAMAVRVNDRIGTTDEEELNIHQYKRAFSKCLTANAGAGSPTKVPFVCQEALRQLRGVATDAEVNKIIGDFEENTIEN